MGASSYEWPTWRRERSSALRLGAASVALVAIAPRATDLRHCAPRAGCRWCGVVAAQGRAPVSYTHLNWINELLQFLQPPQLPRKLYERQPPQHVDGDWPL